MKRIVTQIEYEAIMTRVNELMEIVDDLTPATDKNLIELDFLTDLVVAYEKEHYPIGKLLLSDVMKSRMEDMNITQQTLAEMLEISPPRVSEYLNGKSESTLQIARRIHKRLNIDANIILGSI